MKPTPRQTKVEDSSFCGVCRHVVYDLRKHQQTEEHRRNARRRIKQLQEQL